MEKETLDSREAAALLGCCVATVRAKSKELGGVQVGRRLMFLKKNLLGLFSSGIVPPQANETGNEISWQSKNIQSPANTESGTRPVARKQKFSSLSPSQRVARLQQGQRILKKQ